MQIQVVTFHLKGMTREDYDALCAEMAPAFAVIPGLISKVWLADESTNTYGGVYTWRDRSVLEAFLKTELFRSVVNHANLADLTSRLFGVLEGPTLVTGAARLVAV